MLTSYSEVIEVEGCSRCSPAISGLELQHSTMAPPRSKLLLTCRRRSRPGVGARKTLYEAAPRYIHDSNRVAGGCPAAAVVITEKELPVDQST